MGNSEPNSKSGYRRWDAVSGVERALKSVILVLQPIQKIHWCLEFLRGLGESDEAQDD